MTFLIAVDTICKKVADKVYLSKTSLCQLQQQKEFQGETEDMVIMNCIEGLKEEFEERLGDQSPRFYDDEQLSWFEKKNKELSSLRQQLDAISKSQSFPEIGHISSHGSMEIGQECNNNKRTDHLHRKVSGASLWEGNGQHDESEIAVPENLDYGQLEHMTKALVSYFKTQMTNMKRNHELKVQEMTEENISLKRKCLRERGSSLPFKTDKEFDTLRKKIAAVILKLDDNLSDNRQLRGMITDKKSKVKRLSSQVSDTAEIMLQHSVAKEKLVKRIEHLQSALVDACFEASITEDVYKCLLSGVVNSNSSATELSDIESSSKYDFEDSAMESIIMQELCGVIFKESLKEAKEKLFDLNLKYTNEHELRVHVETEALQKEEALSLEVSEKEKLKQQTCLLSSLMEENDKVAKEAAAAFVKEKEQFELVSQELKNLRNETSRQEMLISERSKESDAMKRELSIALEMIEGHKLELRDLRDKFTLKMNEIGEIDEEIRMLVSVSQEKERKHKRQIQSLTILVQCLYTSIADFECRVMEDITKNNMRLDNLSSQLRALIRKAKVIKGTELMYKQRLERRSSDLQKAEAEVDLLGDKVDALSSLLEKIYIALDHYSPVLQHYPGIIETLKLVRRELGGKYTKPA